MKLSLAASIGFFSCAVLALSQQSPAPVQRGMATGGAHAPVRDALHRPVTAGGFAYIGTLDHKLLILDEEKEEVVGEITAYKAGHALHSRFVEKILQAAAAEEEVSTSTVRQPMQSFA